MKNTGEIKVSVITPTYNSEKYISKTVDSVLNQTHKNFELIIIDDCSTDRTLEIVKEKCEADNRIKLLKLEKNSGPAVARNTGIKHAQGDYIAFLDADDLWKNNKLERQLNFMLKKQINVSFTGYDLINESGEKLNTRVTALHKVDYKKMLKSNYIGNLTGMYNVRALGKVYMPNLKKRQDWGLWLKCIKKEGCALGLNESLAFYRIRKNSVSSNKIKLIKHNYLFYKKACGFNSIKACSYLLVFLFEHFFVKSKLTKKIN